MPRSRWTFGYSLLALLVLGSIAAACSVPVFRYALERWRHDRPEELFRLTVFHSGPLTEDLTRSLADLQPRGGALVNWRIDVVDPTGTLSKAQQDLWEQQQKDATLPWMVLQAPQESDHPKPLHAGPLDLARLKAWSDSPARQKIAAHLLRGASVVWVLVESGEKDRDDAVAERVGKELRRLEQVTRLPEQDDDKESVLRSRVPLRIEFPLVRLGRAAPGEAEFLRQLLTLDEDYTGETGPLLFPIFGRGRLLTGLREKEMTPRLLEDATRFLCGACSCRVKAQNPGSDLLWTADWDSILDEDARPAIVPMPVSDLNPPTTASPEPIPLPRQTTPEPMACAANEAAPTLWNRTALLSGIGMALALVLLTGWWLIRSGQS